MARRLSEASWEKPAAVCRRSIITAESTESKTLKKQDPKVIGTANRTNWISSS